MLMIVGLGILSLHACSADRGLATSVMQDSTTQAQRIEAGQTMATWNAIALRTTAAGPFSPPQESRTMAIVSAAVFDAVNSIGGKYQPFVVRIAAGADASVNAAIAATSRRVLRTLYPNAATTLDADYDSSVARIPAGASKSAGIAVGEAVAAAVLAWRASDRAADRAIYTPQNVVGMWSPTPPAFAPALEAGWGHVQPFVLDSGSQFRPAPPPALTSAAYARDLQEIIDIGGASSQTRTAAQTETARFWIATAAQLWNQVVRQLTVSGKYEPAAVARVYLLMNVAGADAVIAAWDAKFAFQQWRPVTAIRRGASAGTPIDTTWTPLITTPPFPDYPAGHTSFGGAAEVVLERLLGEKPGEFGITSPTAAGATHRYQSVRDVAEEVVNARVWGGVHWRTSSIVGREIGRSVAAVALRRAMPVR